RTVLVPAAVTTAVVVGIVVGLGGGANVLSFLTEQDSRGLQIESIWSTPWLLVGLFSTSVTRFLDQTLNTWEITGPGTSVAANALGVLFDVAILAVVALVWWRRVRLGARLWEDATARHELLVRGALVMTLAMLACNKVLSPQYITWLAGPVAVAIAAGLPGWTRTRSGVLMVAGATQLVFPCFYNQITSGGAAVTLVLAARNAALVVLLVWSVAALLGRPPDEAHTDVARARASSAAHMAR
ncbi:MAG: hypothetical protein FWF28_00385, partial [Micrococcales bacterium]|nr:hypothetical protein [Micrococcales bacterium]